MAQHPQGRTADEAAVTGGTRAPEHVSAPQAGSLAAHSPVVVNPNGWQQFSAILRKDLAMELRTGEMITSMGLYTLLTMVVYFVALQAAGTTFDFVPFAPGLLWVSFIFMSMLGLNRSLVHEKDQGVIEALLLSPVDRPIIYFAKTIGNLTFMLIVEVLAVPVFYFLFLQGAKGIDANYWMLALAFVGGSIGIAGLGTLLATLTVNTKGQDFLLTVLMVPTMFPLLYGAVTATNVAFLSPDQTVKYWGSMGFVAGFDVIMLLAAFGLYEFVIGA